MRIVDRVHGETSSRAFDTGYSGAGPTREGPASENGSAQSPFEPNALRRTFASAISWSVTHLMKGFAAYGEAISASSVDLGGLTDSREPESDSEPCRSPQIEYRNDARWLNASYAEIPWRSAKTRTASPGWSATTASSVIRFWSRMLRARRIRLTITRLEALDDHMLKDIGIHRSQIGSVARDRGLYHW